jgi:hypothetical protein
MKNKISRDHTLFLNLLTNRKFFCNNYKRGRQKKGSNNCLTTEFSFEFLLISYIELYNKVVGKLCFTSCSLFFFSVRYNR